MGEKQRRAIFLGRSDRQDTEIADYAEEYLREQGFIPEWINVEQTEGKKKLTEAYLGEADMIVSFEQAGFQSNTQSGSFLYNILPVKSIHFMGSNRDAVYDLLKGRKVSLALFLVCQGMEEEEAEKLKESLSNVPWLYACRNIRQDIRKILEEIMIEINPPCYVKSN